MLKEHYKVYEEKMKKSVEAVERDFGAVRAGRANASVLNRIQVDYYGTPTPIQQIAAVASPDPRTLLITPWDTSALKGIEKAIQESDLGINPQNDGKSIRLAFPQLTEERRKELVKQIRKYNEGGKVAIRNIRRDALEAFKKMQKASEITEDELKLAEKDLQKMIDKGYFGDEAYLNMELGYLFRSGQADADLKQKRRQEEAAAAPPPKETEEGCSGILRRIRRANDAIADPGLSAKIDRLETITAKIFRAVEEDPKKRDRIDTFLNYYLPTTQKLLDSYAEFEAAGVEGENLRQAKARIESTMDLIIKGFEHQLDELYKADAMDVDSDIRVMETMLERDTASVEKDFGLGEFAAEQKPEETE